MQERKHWWEGYPWRMLQTNLRQIDMADINAAQYVADLKNFGATVVTLNAAGIIASYPTALDFQTQSEYLTGDSLADIIRECHAQGIKVIARTDFSKIRVPVFEQHPDWAYRDKDGNIVNYNGDVQTCPNGAYQREKILEILEEVLTKYEFDGVFFNMSGFLVVDYSGVYHGPCHCENCKRMFKEMYGQDMEIPQRDDPKIPSYRNYSAFKGAVLKAHKERVVNKIRSINPEIAINGVDYIRTESGTEIGVDPWQYSASSNARLTALADRRRPADNASVDFLGFRYRDTSVSPALMELRQWQNLAYAGSTSLYIMGRLDNHRDISGFAPTKKVFDFHKANEAVLTKLTSAAEVLLVRRTLMTRIDAEVSGWIKALTQLHIPFDEVKQAELNKDVLAGKKVVILPDAKLLQPQQAALIDEFAKCGGTVIASGESGMKADPSTLACLGIEAVTGKEKALMSTLFEVPAGDETFLCCKEAPYIAIGPVLVNAQYKEGVQKYLELVPEHPFGPPERCYFDENTKKAVPGVSANSFGEGKGVYIPWLPGEFYFNEGYQNTLNFLADTLYRVAGVRELTTNLSPMTELVLCRHEDGSLVAQIINESGCFGNHYFAPIPMQDITLTLPGRFETATALNGGDVQLEGSSEETTIHLSRLQDFEAVVLK